MSIEKVTHNVHNFIVERPEGYNFTPGQATEVSINKPKWKDETRPFTFTSLVSDPFLRFTIKSYFDHDGVTNELSRLTPGDELIIRDIWGAIEYKGPGYFIAGGAGVTPFIAILRDLNSKNETGDNKLFFSNKTSDNIILKEEFEVMLGRNFVNVLTSKDEKGYLFGRIDEEFLKKQISDFSKYFYICGPPAMITNLQNTLKKLGASVESLVFEK